ncbi:MAG: hypothetical protein ABFS02_10370 [Pseudomonadota bacterium]
MIHFTAHCLFWQHPTVDCSRMDAVFNRVQAFEAPWVRTRTQISNFARDLILMLLWVLNSLFYSCSPEGRSWLIH